MKIKCIKNYGYEFCTESIYKISAISEEDFMGKLIKVYAVISNDGSSRLFTRTLFAEHFNSVLL